MNIHDIIVPIYNGSIGGYWVPWWDVDLMGYPNFPIGFLMVVGVALIITFTFGVWYGRLFPSKEDRRNLGSSKPEGKA